MSRSLLFTPSAAKESKPPPCAQDYPKFNHMYCRCVVLPPLCAELRNMVMQPMILPMVLTIAESQDKNDFELSTLPALVPVLSTAAGETLLLLVKHAELIINKASQEHLVSHVLPMLVRAYDDNDARLQEEVLKKSVSLAKQLDVQDIFLLDGHHGDIVDLLQKPEKFMILKSPDLLNIMNVMAINMIRLLSI
ncbi:unnamed protein product [Ilex paraguariensis]|uniref:Uncharacterized protein n=1 Tax=Ilex paraguariensis TaxID=185542 RepID=A0ABC8RXD0_9AQUA